jgi:hypothetical protein
MVESKRAEKAAEAEALQAVRDEERIRTIEAENNWKATIGKELLGRLRAQKPSVDQSPVARPRPEELLAAVRDNRLRTRARDDPELLDKLRALKTRVEALENGQSGESDAAYRFLNDNSFASNAHMFNHARTPLPPAPPGKQRVDYRKCDKTSLWCASWELAMG